MFSPKESVVLQRNAPLDAKKSIKDFISNSTLKQAHETQSDLAQVARNMENKFAKMLEKKVTPPSADMKDYHEVVKLRERIQEGMQKFLTLNNAEDIGAAYKEAGKRYAKEFVPYKGGDIERYKKGDINAKRLIKALQDSTRAKGAGKNYSEIPGFSTKKNIEPYLKPAKENLIKGAAGAGGVGLAYELGLPGLAKLIEMIGG